MSKANLTDAMRRVLENVERGQHPRAHLPHRHGRRAGLKAAAESGGLQQTIRALLRRGLMDDEYKLTDAGREALRS